MFEFDGAIVRDAIIATFKRRSTDLPHGLPAGPAPEFANDLQKVAQWQAVINR